MDEALQPAFKVSRWNGLVMVIANGFVCGQIIVTVSRVCLVEVMIHDAGVTAIGGIKVGVRMKEIAHFRLISVSRFEYKAVMQDGGFVNGCIGSFKGQNCPLV